MSILERSRRNRALLLASLVAVLGAASCSKSYSPTSPYGGGGTGGGGGAGGGGAGALFNFGPFAVGQSASRAFTTAGNFGYHCIPHRAMGMTGTVQVDATGADSALVQIAANGLNFTPTAAHIKPGGAVRWVNASASNEHTVTSD